MTNKKLSRRRVIATLFGLTLFSILVVGSGTQVVTIARITSQVATVIELLELVDETSGSILASVDNAYQDLGSYLKDNNFTTDVVQSMEGQYAELDARFSELTSNLNKAESEANTLFTLLKSRADENTTPELKQTMMSRISEKEDSFNLKIDDANQVLEKVSESIQKYNDILGFVQVTVGLDAADDYINQVNAVLAESNILRTDIEQAIEEASTIINSSAEFADPSNSSVSSPPQSNLNDGRFPMQACGDENPPGSQTFYPVFVSPPDQQTLDYIRNSYCGDAFVKTREGLNEKFIQVASFQDEEKALQFSNILLSDPRIGKAEVGAPSQF
jgi:ElaB/YqjD/DUF883 family membrane-anchored ribosome-binding protein